MHHAHTNVIGLGDSSVWKVPFLPRFTYLFLAPLAVPIITPLVALSRCTRSNISAENAILRIDPEPSDPVGVPVRAPLSHPRASLFSSVC